MRAHSGLLQADRSAERRLADQLLQLHADALRVEDEHAVDIANVQPTLRPSARNLLHYSSLRQHDIRTLQRQFLACGLSSLSSSGAHTLTSLEATLARLDPSFRPAGGRAPVDFLSGPMLLAEHAHALLGPRPSGAARAS